jgi:hypothetical protein
MFVFVMQGAVMKQVIVMTPDNCTAYCSAGNDIPVVLKKPDQVCAGILAGVLKSVKQRRHSAAGLVNRIVNRAALLFEYINYFQRRLRKEAVNITGNEQINNHKTGALNNKADQTIILQR